MKLSKFLYATLLGLVAANLRMCIAPDPPSDDMAEDDDDIREDIATSGAGGGSEDEEERNRMRGAEDTKKKTLIKSGCNFYERTDLQIQPFSRVKKDEESCNVTLSENADAFLYACDGTSEPAQCPNEVKTEDGVKKLKSFFTQATVTNESMSYEGAPNVFHVITGKANKSFTATCECTKADGKKEVMKLVSSFVQIGTLVAILVPFLAIVK